MKTQHTRLQHTTKYEQQLYKEWFSPIYTIDDCINRIPIADQSRCSVLQSRMSRYEGRFINLRLAFAIGSHVGNVPATRFIFPWSLYCWCFQKTLRRDGHHHPHVSNQQVVMAQRHEQTSQSTNPILKHWRANGFAMQKWSCLNVSPNGTDMKRRLIKSSVCLEKASHQQWLCQCVLLNQY